MLLAAVLLTNFLAAPSLGLAAVRCEKILDGGLAVGRAGTDGRSEPRFEANGAAQRLLRMGPALFSRYGKDPQVILLYEKILANGEGPLQFQMGFSKKEGPGGIQGSLRHFVVDHQLVYEIPSVKLAEDGQSLEYGGRPEGLNTAFPRVLTAIFMAVRTQVQGNPQISQVEIVAQIVMNKDLAELLRGLGFKPAKEPSTDSSKPGIGLHWSISFDVIRGEI